MISISITRDHQGRIVAFRVEGHAGYGTYGEDIVCAAVSALTQAAVIGLEEYLGLQPAVVIEPGLLECRLKERPADLVAQTDAILETMVLGLGGVAAEYPNCICITEGEVD
ncbi:MAG TPA: ribosomal-processing cysteine protease Prp [Firmicutes bacterium]|nr:ribosomal-processing cysteine protease Prp [Bacillota bacterium]